VKRISDKKMLPTWFCNETYEPLKTLSDNELVEQLNRRFSILSWLDYLESSHSQTFVEKYTGVISDKEKKPLIETNLHDYFKSFDESHLEGLAEINIAFNKEHELRLILPGSGMFRNASDLNYSVDTPAIFNDHPLVKQFINSELLLINLDGYTNEELVSQFKIALSLARKKHRSSPIKCRKSRDNDINMILKQKIISIADLKVWERVNHIKYEDDTIMVKLFFGEKFNYQRTILENFKKFKKMFDNQNKLKSIA